MTNAEQHSNRFRKVSNRYPRRVAEAYEGDVGQAMADNDEQVAAAVVAWERRQGLRPRNWAAIGATEREFSDDDAAAQAALEAERDERDTMASEPAS